MKDRFSLKRPPGTPYTVIPPASRKAQEQEYQCVCCWNVVKGSEFDFENQLCGECSQALIHLEKRP